jgi:hypothetical protein
MYIAAKQASILNIRLVFNKYAVKDTFLFSMQFCPALACPGLPWPALACPGLPWPALACSASLGSTWPSACNFMQGICIWSHDKLISSTGWIYLVKERIFVGTRNSYLFFIKSSQQIEIWHGSNVCLT